MFVPLSVCVFVSGLDSEVSSFGGAIEKKTLCIQKENLAHG